MATRPRLVGLPLEPVLAIRPACCSAGLSDRCGTRTTAQPAGSSPPHASRSRRWPAPLFPVLLTRDRSASARGVVGGVSASVGVQCSCYLPLLPLGAVEAIHTFKQTDGWGTRPDQTRPAYIYAYVRRRARAATAAALRVRRPPPVVPPTSRVPVRRSCSMRCGADRPSKKTNSHHSGSFVFTAGKEKKRKKNKEGKPFAVRWWWSWWCSVLSLSRCTGRSER